jgi:hypothetical protein
VEILDSARKHGHADEDILHAASYPLRIYDLDDMRMIIGPDRAGNLLEVGVSVRSMQPIIVHAMAARPRWLR